MNGIFSTISSTFSRFEHSTYSKSSMLAISHALEDVVLNFELHADLFVSFQSFEFFLAEKQRYLKLEKCCRKVFVFVRHIDRHQLAEFTNTVFVEIDPHSPLADEWSVIVNHPTHPIVLTTTERYDLRTSGGDDFRYFKGFLSFDPVVVKVAVHQVLLNLKALDISYNPSPISEASLTPCEQDMSRKISLFINRMLNQIEAKTSQLVSKNMILNAALQDNKQLSLEMIQRLCYAAEFRDYDASGHLAQISLLSAQLYSLAGGYPQEVEDIRYASMMHDIGKIGIPDAILHKPGKLTRAEFEIMKTHTTIGAKILRESSCQLIQMGCLIAQNHHERWNGRGYPCGLSGKDIPFVARIVAIVDVFEALVSQRVYKDSFPIEDSIRIIRGERNQRFDGELVDLFIENVDHFANIFHKKNIG